MLVPEDCSRTIRKERKARPKPKRSECNELTKRICALAKIKEHQQKETIEAKHKESEKPTPPHSGNTSYGGLDGNAFEDEFRRSLAYLSASGENVKLPVLTKKSKRLS